MTSLSSFTGNLHDKVAITMFTFDCSENLPGEAAAVRDEAGSGREGQVFGRVIRDEAYAATADNVEQLRTLCDELGFSSFDGDSRRFGR